MWEGGRTVLQDSIIPSGDFLRPMEKGEPCTKEVLRLNIHIPLLLSHFLPFLNSSGKMYTILSLPVRIAGLSAALKVRGDGLVCPSLSSPPLGYLKLTEPPGDPL